MKDSKVDQGWLQRTMQAYPPQKLPNGIILSGPVRLAFVNLTQRGKPQKRDDGSTGEGKFGCAVLFPTGEQAYMEPLYRLWYEEAHRSWADYFDRNTNRFHNLEWPFHDQATKAYGPKPKLGYTPGNMFMNVSSNFKPSIVDTAMNDIIDESRIYAGVWAIVGMNQYVYGRNPPRPKKGVGFGIQSVVLIGDDQRLAGGAADPKKVFEGVNITAMVDPVKQFGLMPTGQGQQGSMPSYPLPPSGAPAAPPAGGSDILANLLR